jgi:hypothetical protein
VEPDEDEVELSDDRPRLPQVALGDGSRFTAQAPTRALPDDIRPPSLHTHQMNPAKPPGELDALLAAERRALQGVRAQLEARDRQQRSELTGLARRVAELKAQHPLLETRLADHLTATTQLEAVQAQLGRGLSTWQRGLARAIEPALAASALFLSILAWGFLPFDAGTLLAEGLGLTVGLGGARLWSLRG